MIAQSAASSKMDAIVNVNVINGGTPYPAPISSCVPIPYLSRLATSKPEFKEPETTFAAQLRDIDMLFAMDLKESYMNDDKFIGLWPTAS